MNASEGAGGGDDLELRWWDCQSMVLSPLKMSSVWQSMEAC